MERRSRHLQQNIAGERQENNNLLQPVGEERRYGFLRELENRDATLIHAPQDVEITNITYESCNRVGQDIVERNLVIESLGAVMRRKMKEAQEKASPATRNTTERGSADS